MSGSKVQDHFSRRAEGVNELTTLGAFLRTVCPGVVSWQTPDDMTRVCDDVDVVI